MRLIDADALERRMNERLRTLEAENGPYDHYACGYEDAIDEIEDAPTVEAEPVRHGRWIEDGCYNTCSLCGSSFDRYDDGGYYQDFDYCPKCGQPMDAKDIDVPGKICPATKLPCCDCVPGTPCAKMDGGSK